jgi:hypothetical protein
VIEVCKRGRPKIAADSAESRRPRDIAEAAVLFLVKQHGGR